MQVVFCVNVLLVFVLVQCWIGYDCVCFKDFYGFFINECIFDCFGIYVLDVIGSFCELLGLVQDMVSWDLVVLFVVFEWVQVQWEDDGWLVLIILFCFSYVCCNWYVDCYVVVVNYVIVCGWWVVLCGGCSMLEWDMIDVIQVQLQILVFDLVGKDMFKQFFVLFVCVNLVMMFDFGLMYIVNVMGVKVLGLYVVSNFYCSGFYLDCCYCVDCYDDVVWKFFGKLVSELKWGVKVEFDDVMQLIIVEDGIVVFEWYVVDWQGWVLFGIIVV